MPRMWGGKREWYGFVVSWVKEPVHAMRHFGRSETPCFIALIRMCTYNSTGLLTTAVGIDRQTD